MISQRESFLRSRADEAGPVTAEGHVLPVRFMFLNAAPLASADQNSWQACPTVTFAQQSQFSMLEQHDAGPVSIPISTQQLATPHSYPQNDQIQAGQQPAQLGYSDHVEVIGDTGFVTLLPIPMNINTSSTLAFANHGDGQAIGERGVRREDDPLLPGTAVLNFPNNRSTGPAGYSHYLPASAATDALDLSIARPTEASPNMVGTPGATTAGWPHEGEHLLQHREQQQHAPAGRPMSIIENVQDLRALLGSKLLTREDLTSGINSNGAAVDQHQLCQDIIGSMKRLSRVSTGMTAAATTQTGREASAAAHSPQAPEAETTIPAAADALAAVPNHEEGTHVTCVKLLVCQNNIARVLPKKLEYCQKNKTIKIC
jgi:hypothetical protein